MLAGHCLGDLCGPHIKARERHGKVPSPRKTVNNAFFIWTIKGLFRCSLLSGFLAYALSIKALWKQHEEQILKSLPAAPGRLSTNGSNIIAPDDLVFIVQAHFPAVGGGGVEKDGLCQLFGKAFTVYDGDHF